MTVTFHTIWLTVRLDDCPLFSVPVFFWLTFGDEAAR